MAINYSALISTLVKNLLKSGTFLYLSFEQNYPKLPASFCKCLCLVSQCKDICAEPWEMYQACSNGKYISAKCVRLLVSISPKRHSTNSFLLKTVLFLDLNKTLKARPFLCGEDVHAASLYFHAVVWIVWSSRVCFEFH